MKYKIKKIFYITCGVLGLTSVVLADTGVDDKTVSQSFKVQAEIIKGCLLGSGGSDTSSFGTISFGNVSLLNQNKDVISSANAGSIIVKCTPGINVTISLNSGVNNSGSISNGRLLKNANTNETLSYQLFQDANFSSIWGNGSNGGSSKIISSSGTAESYPIYARLLAASTMPSVGTYTDTVTVTISY